MPSHTRTGRFGSAQDPSRPEAGIETHRSLRILLIGPTSAPWATIAASVEADLALLARPGVVLEYRRTGAGPESVRTPSDVAAASSHVVATAAAGEAEGYDAMIVDCTDDPGVAEARAVVATPIVGAGEALRAAIADVDGDVVHLDGDTLRALDASAFDERLGPARTVAIGATGFSPLVATLARRHPGVTFLDPLALAIGRCVGRGV